MGHPASLVGLRLFAETRQNFEIGAGSVCDFLWMAFVNCVEVDEIAADAKSPSASLHEGCGSFEGDAAGGNELEKGKWREKSFEIAGAAHCGTREDFDVVRAGSPGGDDFSWSESAGNRQLAVCLCDLDDFGMKTGANDEFGSGVDGGLGFGWSGDGAGTEEDSRAVFPLQFLEKIDCAGDGHGDFDDRDAAGDHGLNNSVGLSSVARAKDRNKADAFDDFCCGLRHFVLHCIERRLGNVRRDGLLGMV
jgi:hypothetical protein